MIEYIVSACLAGCNCRYDGGNNRSEKVVQLVQQGRALPVCPEQLGGLSTPRPPFEIVDARAVDKNGNDITEQMQRGAEEALALAKMAGCTKAILQLRSPSCGVGRIYDGTFSGVLIEGNGMFAQQILNAGIVIESE